ncbi:hypothetical protein EUGRSUZ_C04312 [Eucalyptus grandis]|uniref:Leucine-rich repeat-containing N-terminal plant-type domain-containing protein n=2 Tax=Eucalyptus grandis TaxID=71139 RepID=A0A059CXS2_EUCGR|nr:hypothetical protein EUGRSUZ_C04312 [Eucalyptus grandis]
MQLSLKCRININFGLHFPSNGNLSNSRMIILIVATSTLTGLCRLRNLEELDISRNELWGPLLSCFCNMTSLRVLNVEDNSFSEAIPLSILSNLKSLEFINFSGNAFEGSLLLASLANNSKLETFSHIDNQNRLEVNTEDPTWFPSFRLKVFMLSNCVLNKDANGVIPSFLKEQYNLRFVQLNHNGMTGNFPKWLLDNNVNLVWLELRGNNLSSAFYLPSNLNPISMWWLDVSANIIDRELPSQIGFIFRNLIGFNMSNNHLKGEIPSSMGTMNQLSSLDLSNNGFIGEIQETPTKNCTAISILKLLDNILQGQMLPRNSSLENLRILDLASNLLDVSNNSLSGTLPHWIGDLRLQVLILSSNLFRGPLPSSFCNIQELFFLDLSSNNLGPSTPLCASVTYLRFLHLTNDMLMGHFPKFLLGASWIVTLDLRHNALSGNNFEGLIPQDLCLLEKMSILDLSNNNISGQIPSCLNKLRFHQVESCMMCDVLYPGPVALTRDMIAFAFEFEEVKFMTKRRMELYKGYILKLMSGMDLSWNNLTGFIPSNFGNLSELRALNLSHNHLTGPIPKMFSNLKEVESLDLSYNNLNGPIPPQLIELYTLTPDLKYQFGTFGEESYEGNPLLCGPPLTSCDGPNPRQGTPQSFNHTGEDDFWREVFLWSFAGSYVVAFLGVVLFLYLNSYYQYVLFELDFFFICFRIDRY